MTWICWLVALGASVAPPPSLTCEVSEWPSQEQVDAVLADLGNPTATAVPNSARPLSAVDLVLRNLAEVAKVTIRFEGSSVERFPGGFAFGTIPPNGDTCAFLPLGAQKLQLPWEVYQEELDARRLRVQEILKSDRLPHHQSEEIARLLKPGMLRQQVDAILGTQRNAIRFQRRTVYPDLGLAIHHKADQVERVSVVQVQGGISPVIAPGDTFHDHADIWDLLTEPGAVSLPRDEPPAIEPGLVFGFSGSPPTLVTK